MTDHESWFLGVSCPESGWRMAVGGYGVHAYADDLGVATVIADGRVSQTVMPNYLTAVSCSSPSYCLASTAYGPYQKWNGSTWTAVPLPFQQAGDQAVRQISCVSGSRRHSVPGGASGSH